MWKPYNVPYAEFKLSKPRIVLLSGIAGLCLGHSSTSIPLANFLVYNIQLGQLREVASQESLPTPVREDLLRRTRECSRLLRDWTTYAPVISVSAMSAAKDNRKAIDNATWLNLEEN